MQSERHKMFTGRLELLQSHPSGSDSESRGNEITTNSEEPLSFETISLQVNPALNPEEAIGFHMVNGLLSVNTPSKIMAFSNQSFHYTVQLASLVQ